MRRALVVLAAVGVLVGCGADAGDQAAQRTDTTTNATAGAGGAAAVPSALDFEAPLIDGTTFDARQFAGETAVLWFWAPY